MKLRVHNIPKKGDSSEFHNSFQVQVNVIKALFMREMISHFGRYNIGFLWMFMEPMMFSIGIAILWSFSGHSFGVMPAAGFALTGYSVIVAWRSCVGKTAASIRANKGLLYHRNVTILDILFTRALFEFSAVTVSLMTLTILFYFLSLINYPVDMLKIIVAWVLLGWFFIASGLIAAYLTEKSHLFERVWHVLMYLTLPLTGALSMVSWLPNSIQELVLLSPMVNGTEMLREGYFGPAIKAHYSAGYLVACNIFATFVALHLTKNINKLMHGE